MSQELSITKCLGNAVEVDAALINEELRRETNVRFLRDNIYTQRVSESGIEYIAESDELKNKGLKIVTRECKNGGLHLYVFNITHHPDSSQSKQQLIESIKHSLEGINCIEISDGGNYLYPKNNPSLALSCMT